MTTSDWIPANERERMTPVLDIKTGKYKVGEPVVQLYLAQLLDHAAEADRRIAERDQLLIHMAASLQAVLEDHSGCYCDHLPIGAKCCDWCENNAAWCGAINMYEALLEGTT